MSEMNKAEIVAQLEAMVWHRLFNCRQWLADREKIYAVNLKLTKTGFGKNAYRPTPGELTISGKGLMLICSKRFIMGIWDVWEVPYILEHHRLIDECESDSICAYACLRRLIRNLFWWGS